MEQMSLNLETQSELGYLRRSHTTSTPMSPSLSLSVFVVFLSLILSVSYFLSVFTPFFLSVFTISLSLLSLSSSLHLYHFRALCLHFFALPSVLFLPFTDCLWCLPTNPLLWPLDIKLQVTDNQQSNKQLQLYLHFSRHTSQAPTPVQTWLLLFAKQL